jgi:hypothetical protein
MPKRIGDDVGDLKYIFTTPQRKLFLWKWLQLIMQEYDSKCHKMCLITLKVFKIC